MKTRSLHLNKIGVFENETISFPEKKDKDLAEIHIFTGQNGTGKNYYFAGIGEWDVSNRTLNLS